MHYNTEHIKVTYIPADDMQPARLHAFAGKDEGIIENYDTDIPIDEHAKLLAQRYLDLCGYGQTHYLCSFDILKNNGLIAWVGHD